jgi:DNA-directed RNA polymerase specialized sigma24 family protein
MRALSQDAPVDGSSLARIDVVADCAAFAELFIQPAPRVKGFLRRLGRDYGMAEAVTQDGPAGRR